MGTAVCGRGHSAQFLWSCRASRFNSSGAGHGMSSHGRRGRAALCASIAPGHLYRRSVNFSLCFFIETSRQAVQLWVRSHRSQPHTTLDNQPILLCSLGACFTGHFLSQWPLALIARSHVLVGASAPAFVVRRRPTIALEMAWCCRTGGRTATYTLRLVASKVALFGK